MSSVDMNNVSFDELFESVGGCAEKSAENLKPKEKVTRKPKIRESKTNEKNWKHHLTITLLDSDDYDDMDNVPKALTNIVAEEIRTFADKEFAGDSDDDTRMDLHTVADEMDDAITVVEFDDALNALYDIADSTDIWVEASWIDSLDGIEEGKIERGKRDGTGPYKDSAQAKQGKVGKRKAAGEKCPKEGKIPTDYGDEQKIIKDLTEGEEDEIEDRIEPDIEEELPSDEPEDLEDPDMTDGDDTTMYFAKSDDAFYYLVVGDGGSSFKIIDQEDNEIFTSAEGDYANVVDFISAALRELDVDEMAIDVYNTYILPALVDEEEPDEEDEDIEDEPVEPSEPEEEEDDEEPIESKKIKEASEGADSHSEYNEIADEATAFEFIAAVTRYSDGGSAIKKTDSPGVYVDIDGYPMNTDEMLDWANSYLHGDMTAMLDDVINEPDIQRLLQKIGKNPSYATDDEEPPVEKKTAKAASALKERQINEGEIEKYQWADGISGATYTLEIADDNITIDTDGAPILVWPCASAPKIESAFDVADGFVNMLMEFGENIEVDEEPPVEKKKLKESSRNDFLINYGRELRQLIARGDEYSKTNPTNDDVTSKMSRVERIYDPEVADAVYELLLNGSTSSTFDELVDVAVLISDKYGTEPMQLINALETALP